MNLIFDFDRTLFDTAQFEADLSAIFLRFGVPATLFKSSMRAAMLIQNEDLNFDYTFEKHLAVLKSLGFDLPREILSELNSLVGPHYVFVGVKAMLEFVRPRVESLLLLTAGNPEFQKMKVDKSGLADFFTECIYLHTGKEKIVQDYLTKGRLIFVNDNMKENEIIRTQCLEAQIVGKRALDRDSRELADASGLPYFDSISELFLYLQTIL